MKKLYPLLSVLFLIYWGCEDKNSEENDNKESIIGHWAINSICNYSNFDCEGDCENVTSELYDFNGLSLTFLEDSTAIVHDNDDPSVFLWSGSNPYSGLGWFEGITFTVSNDTLIWNVIFDPDGGDESCYKFTSIRQDYIAITTSIEGSVSGTITINCIATDIDGVEKVELWVNGLYTGVSDNTEPYSLDWNTTTYEDGSYVITIRSYDTSGNTTDSDPMTLIVQQCTNCGGGLIDGYLYKEVTVADIASLAYIDVAVNVGDCIRFKMDGTDFSDVEAVNDCCCILYR